MTWDPKLSDETPDCTDPCRKEGAHLFGSEGCDYIWTYEHGVRANPNRTKEK